MMSKYIKEANREVKAKRFWKVFDAVAVWFMMFVICYVAFMVLRFIIQTNTMKKKSKPIKRITDKEIWEMLLDLTKEGGIDIKELIRILGKPRKD